MIELTVAVGDAHRQSVPNEKLPTFTSASICPCINSNKKAVAKYKQRS